MGATLPTDWEDQFTIITDGLSIEPDRPYKDMSSDNLLREIMKLQVELENRKEWALPSTDKGKELHEQVRDYEFELIMRGEHKAG